MVWITKNGLIVSWNRILRRIFRRDRMTGCWRKLCNEEVHNLYCSPNIRVMGGALSTPRRDEHWTQNSSWKKRNARDHLENLVLDEVVMLKWILNLRLMFWAQINLRHILTPMFLIVISISSYHFHVVSSLRVFEKQSQVYIFHFCTSLSYVIRHEVFYIDVSSGSVILGKHSGSSRTAHPATQLHVPKELSLCTRCDQLCDIWWEVQIVTGFTVAVNGECRLTKGTTVGDDCK